MGVGANVLETLWVKIMGDAEGFSTAMDRVSSIGDKISNFGGQMTARVTLPLASVGAAAVLMASNTEESLNKVNEVFGESADEIAQFASSAATNLGMSEQAALDAAGTFGNLFTAMGMGQDEAAGMSTSLLQLAADLASFNNISPTEALEKLRAGLVGEVEPLRSLGVNLNAAAVEAKAMEMGLADATGQLTPAALAQARYALIVEQTKNAQGDFARTSDGLANSMRIVKARIADAGAKIGSALLPFVAKAVEFVSKLVTWFTNLNPNVMKFILIAGGIAAALGPVLMIVGSLISSIGAIVPVISTVIGFISGPVMLIIGLIVGAILLFKTAWDNNWGGIRDTLIAIWEGTLKPALETLWNWLQVNIPLALAWLANMWNTVLLPALQAVWAFIQANVIPVLQAIFDWLATNIPVAIQAISGFIQGTLIPAFQAVWGFITTYIVPVFTLVAQVVGEILKIAFTVIAGIITNFLVPAFTKVYEIIKTYIIPFFIRLWKMIEENIMPVILDFINSVLGPLEKAFEAVKKAIEWVVQKLKILLEKLKDIKLPDWLTPGSPTPLELGLLGIADALQAASNQAGQFGAELLGLSDVNDMNFVVNGNASSQVAGVMSAASDNNANATATPVIIYGGVTVNGVEDPASFLAQLQGYAI